MIDFIEYVVAELQSKRLSKSHALSLIQQFGQRPVTTVPAAVIHPLLHRNTSDLTQQSYGTRFSGEEFFLRDHRVQGRKVLPGVAYLEMARAAVAHALPERGSTAGLELRHIIWAQPIVVAEPKEIALALFLEEPQGNAARLGFEIYSTDDGEIIHCQGEALFGDEPAPEKHDVEHLREQTSAAHWDASVLYPAMLAAGIDLGPAQQGVQVAHRGTGQLLVEISRPAAAEDAAGEYLLHPSVLDSAVQAAMALVVEPGATVRRPPLPFALESLRIFASCQRQMLAWVRYSPGSSGEQRVIKLDIDLCDPDGNVCVQMLGLSARVMTADSEAPAAEPGTLLAAPCWQREDAPRICATQPNGPQERHVVLCDLKSVDSARLAQDLPLDGPCLSLCTGPDSDLAARYSSVVLACFEKLQALLQAQPRGPVLLQVVAPNDAESLVLAGMAALLQTAARENPNLTGQVIFTESCVSTEVLVAQLRQEAQGVVEPIVKLSLNDRYVRRWKELPEPELAGAAAPAPTFKNDGVYLITGGLGGLGLLFAQEILRATPGARVVLTGRTELTPQRQARLDALHAGGRILYRQLDLEDAAQVTRVVAGLIGEWGRLDGILHSAGMLQDNFILKKSAAELRAVLAPKVLGTENLDRATAAVALDFLVLFSSVSAVYGNPGQADYTAANAFMDGFAGLRNQWLGAGQRQGVTLSINWPLWQQGGMRLESAHQQTLQRLTGMCPMRTATGVRGLYRSLGARHDQVLVVEGDLEQMRAALLAGPAVRTQSATPVVAVERGGLLERAQEFLRRQFSVVLQLAPHRIDPQAPLEQYGIDSIVAMELTTQLELTFGSLPKTLFFEYQTLAQLTDYFLRDYSARLSSLLSGTEHGARPRELPRTKVSHRAHPSPTAAVPTRRRRRHLKPGPVSRSEPIAVVGLSGRYPQSADVEAFWQSLKDGKDCIEEVPPQRWDWRDYYSEDRAATGRHYRKWGGFITGVDEFDPLFFNIPPVDAELIDPQERLFLQHVWMALEDAGCTRASLQVPEEQDLAGQVGVYVGVMYGEYQLFGAESQARGQPIGIPASYASIANRVSYILNVHGPSMALDTMCSSSLTAIHLACQDLRQGRTHVGIAGGVNVSIHPNKYLLLSAGQYISGQGHCQSFGAGGDGYIPGEGVGVVVLKRLSDAERDGNPVYGVIRGSALNHGGKTNGYTVPNLPAQASLIGRALRECNVDARHISYLEAHGTGTRLGDPIEIAALTQAFRRFTQDSQFCRLGSVKSNIGHCESAAGIAGLTKVLLQMRHQLIAPSLHSATLNPHIDFTRSPFVVNQSLCPWEQPEIDGRRVPRIAGISSFGAGGSNAHLVVEEYPAQPAAEADGHIPRVFPLSARTEEQLRQKASDLAAFIRARAQPVDLASLAYTLQMGREAMDVRAGFVASCADELAGKLAALGRGESEIDDCFQGRVARDNKSIGTLADDEDMASALDQWIARGKFPKLLDLWVTGLQVDWRKLYGERRPRFCSLPTYPFAKERYWLSYVAGARDASLSTAAVLHPLLHTNTSDWHQQSYASTFNADERFLTDHQIEISGALVKVLPAVAYLEMARAAVDRALPASGPRCLALQNTVWERPLRVSGKQSTRVALAASEAGQVGFEIVSDPDSDEPVRHCHGRVTLLAESRPARLDTVALEARMTRGRLQPEEIYAASLALGIHYGPAFRGLTGLHRGQGEVLAELAVDEHAWSRVSDYVLHPGLLDSALQAAIGLAADLKDLGRRPAVPFALDDLRLFAPCTARMLAWVRHAPGSHTQDAISKIDIDLCDADGNVCVQMRGLAVRKLGDTDKTVGTLLARPRWEASPIDTAAANRTFDYRSHVVLLCNLQPLDTARLIERVPGMEVRSLQLAGAGRIAERYSDAAVAILTEIHVLSKGTGKVLFQVVVGEAGEDRLLAGLSGLLRSARLENPQLVGQVILTGSTVEEPALALQLQAAGRHPGEALFRYADGRQFVQRWDCEALQAARELALREHGVYLITGGLGGLGSIFAREILTRTTGARVILTGRSELTDAKRAALAQLAAAAAVPAGRLAYRQLDLTRRAAVEQVITDLVQEFGGLQGVIHSAGMTQDRLMIHKTHQELLAVLAPKVLGADHLDYATRALDLDFLVLFSSVSAAFGNAGQTDYAAANGFLDQLASYRNELVSQGERRGRTLSINWPWWEEGGMPLDPEARERLTRMAGITALQTDTGWAAFGRSLELETGQALVVSGEVERLRRVLFSAPVEPPPVLEVPNTTEVPNTPVTDSSAELLDMQQLLSRELAGLLKLPAHEVDPQAPLEKYGIDSVLAMKVTGRLEELFGTLSKTLLFEYQTIAGLAGYLVEAHPRRVAAATGSSAAKRSEAGQGSALAPLVPSKPRFVQTSPASSSRDVAIIGVSGRYPQAANLHEFWENLKNGRDCVSEIPRERWDHAPLYHPERNQAGRSYSKWGGFIAGVDQFDALFFNISPREAELIDPQERLFLETVWETIEDAGYSKEAIARHHVGVFVGVMWGQYELLGAVGSRAGIPSSSFASIANRISYFFNFRGPSLALDTMCSSSLTAIHLACEEIRKGSVDVAVAGGVNVSIHPNKYLNLSQGNFASTDGRCRSFGAGGDGYVPGEGVGAVLLKSLEQALAEGDQVYAIIKASSINHGGKTNGYTVPNPLAQAEVIAATLRQARVDPASISYIETHGTGTALGDPIEITGLAQAFESVVAPDALRAAAQSCSIGSVKSNIGHLESAAGIAALTKTLLQLKHRQLVPSLHAEPCNPNIDFTTTPFRVQTRLEPWQHPDSRPRRAGVSSFGAGGANAHLVLEEFIDPRQPVTATASAPTQPEACLLSAKSQQSLVTYAQKMLAFLERPTAPSLREIAYTSQVGRTVLQERLVVIAADRETLRDKLSQWLQAAQGPLPDIDGVYAGSLRDRRSTSAALLEGDAGQAFVRLTLERRDLRKLAQLWTAGVEVDWSALYGTSRPRKVSLPTYPFMRRRYWIDAQTPEPSVAAPSPELLYYRPQWRALELGAMEAAALSAPVWVLDSGEELLTQLQAREGMRVVLVKADEADILQRVQAVAAAGSLPHGIIHHDTGGLQQGIYALHTLCKALLNQKPSHGVKIISVRAGGADVHSAMHAALGGYFKTLTLEQPRFLGKVVQAPAGTCVQELAALARRELCESSGQSGDIRYRHNHGAGREVRLLERYAPALNATPEIGFKPGGVYLISGGLGGLGYLFSEHLARHYQARLVLLGRSALTADQQRKLTHLNENGAAALYRQVDVTDLAQVQAVVREAKQAFSRLDGVIHSAGIHRDSFILNKPLTELRTVLDAKVTGTLNLERATQEDALDLFILCSSVAGVVGNPGQCDYACANHFLDAFAEQRQGLRPGRTLSINWPLWEEGGMRLSPSDVELAEKRAGLVPLPTRIGLECLETLLRAQCGQALVLYGRGAKIESHLQSKPESNAEPTGSASSVPQVRPPETADELAATTVSYLQALLAVETKLPPEQIDPAERVESFGIDSMMISRMNAVLERDFGELPKTLFYEYATLQELAGYLVREARSPLARFFSLPQADEPLAVELTEAPVPSLPPAPPLFPPVPSLPPPPFAATQPLHCEPIAIVGVHGHFPQSNSLEEYWDHLQAGKDLIEPVPPSRWDSHESYCGSGGFLADVDRFDAELFQISSQDAQLMDPQERLFLQSAWAALEDAGYTRESLKKHFPKANSAGVGVFVGVTSNTYHLLAPQEWSRGNKVNPGSLPWSIANRVSYFFDLQGPSMPVDTACSSSLVAMHLACESLRRGECQMALAGGVNLYLHASKYQSFCERRMLAEHGRCRSFGAGDDGFVPGEGVGTLVLKPLSKALEHHDHIYGLMVASACEHSGRSHGYSAPNPASQAQLITRTLQQANLLPQSIGYVEAHGTGTQLGDSLEILALSQAFRAHTDQTQFCSIGSVKANIGHSESAAGIAGVAKVLLQLKHQRLVPTLHSDPVNPHLDLEHSPFYLQHELTTWEAPDSQPRRAMVNGFGAGGVNACVILEEYRSQRAETDLPGRPQLIVLSARNDIALKEMASRLRNFLLAQPGTDLARLAYTLQVGREAMSERLAIVAADTSELVRDLEHYGAGSASERLIQGRLPGARGRKARQSPARDRYKALYLSGELQALARSWVQGEDLDWEDCHLAGQRPFRLPLPTYPFARERHWVTDGSSAVKPAAPAHGVEQLHPLVSANLSTLKEVSFGSMLSPERYYARDHQVGHQMLFPAAGFLEIACVGGTLAAERKVTSIRDVVWSAPLKIDTPEVLVKTFFKTNGDATEYVSVSLGNDAERVVHSEGRLLYGTAAAHGIDSGGNPSIQELQSRCTQTLEGAECYRRFARHGLHYGPSFQTIQALHIGAGWALARLQLTQALLADFGHYILHPCLLDGALQTVIAFAGEGGDPVPYLPFALDEVRILRPLPPTCYAYAQQVVSEHSRHPDIKQFDISLLNESGEAVLQLSHFYVRALRTPRRPVATV